MHSAAIKPLQTLAIKPQPELTTMNICIDLAPSIVFAMLAATVAITVIVACYLDGRNAHDVALSDNAAKKS